MYSVIYIHTDKKTHIQKDKRAERQSYRMTYIQTDTPRERHTIKRTYRKTHIHKDMQSEGHAEGHREYHAYRYLCIRTNRMTYRSNNIHAKCIHT